MNSFEQFIKTNKDKMNLKEVNPAIWQNIENQMSQKKTNRMNVKFYAIAASTIFAIVLVTLLNSSSNESGFDDAILVNEINNKITHLQAMEFPAAYKTDLSQLVKQVHYLDKQAQSNINYLKTVNQEAYIESLVMQYYQSKNKLLDKLMHEIKRINQIENTYTNTNENSHENTTLSI